VNSTSVWYTSMAFLQLLDNGNKKGNVKQSSQIVVTSSIGGFNKKAPGGWAYGPSKAAATHIAKQLSVVLPTWNIRWVFRSRLGTKLANFVAGRIVSAQDVSIFPVAHEFISYDKVANIT
jgi:hypothetical protein